MNISGNDIITILDAMSIFLSGNKTGGQIAYEETNKTITSVAKDKDSLHIIIRDEEILSIQIDPETIERYNDLIRKTCKALILEGKINPDLSQRKK